MYRTTLVDLIMSGTTLVDTMYCTTLVDILNDRHDLGRHNVLHDLGDVCKRLNLPCDLITIILIVLMYATGN